MSDEYDDMELLEKGSGWDYNYSAKNNDYLWDVRDSTHNRMMWYSPDLQELYLYDGPDDEPSQEIWCKNITDLARVEARGQEVGLVTKSGEWLLVAAVPDAAGLVTSIMKAVRAAKAALLPPPPAGFDL